MRYTYQRITLADDDLEVEARIEPRGLTMILENKKTKTTVHDIPYDEAEAFFTKVLSAIRVEREATP